MEAREEKIREAVKSRYATEIEAEKQKIIKDVEALIAEQERIEKEKIKIKLIQKERKKELERQAREELIKEGLITPDPSKRIKKSDD